VPDILLPQDQSHYLLTRDGLEAPRAEAMLFCDWLQQQLAAEKPAPEKAETPATAAARRRRSHG